MQPNPQSGYSLVELLVVLALLGLIAIAVSGGLSFGARVWERTERTVSSAELSGGGHQVLRALLSGVHPRKTGEAGQTRTVEFDGARERMALLTASSAQLGASGIAKVTLVVERTGGAANLKLTLESEVDGLPPRIVTLVSGAQAIEFAYGDTGGGAVAWSDTWASRATPPPLIRIRVRPTPGQPAWPELVVRTRIDRPADCIFDPVSFECRNV